MSNKILIVDDDREFREEFADCLEEYDVIEASNGDEALNILKQPNEIDLVILDIRMPGKSGTEILKKIKKMSPETGVIMLTGYASKDTAIEALRGRADEYIEKPLDIDRTKEVIEKILENVRQEEDITAMDVKGKIEKVKRFIERNCRKRVWLNDAAKVVCLSPKYLSRIFKENTGMGFNDYRLKVKIEKAKELLYNTGYSIKQMAYMLGFQNPESFMRIFKKTAGITPTEYRKKKNVKNRKNTSAK